MPSMGTYTCMHITPIQHAHINYFLQKLVGDMAQFREDLLSRHQPRHVVVVVIF